jgi:drug/metabolite transporter (DMT)-like permease
MNVGLLYTPVSIYQMTRGALVLFVGIFSVIFLQRRLWFYQFSCITFASSVPQLIFIIQDGHPLSS